jgi:hypothetical protein
MVQIYHDKHDFIQQPLLRRDKLESLSLVQYFSQWGGGRKYIKLLTSSNFFNSYIHKALELSFFSMIPPFK